jgi:DNA-binding CsgD family transcriptional regulator
MEVLDLLIARRSDAQIAERLVVSEHTVKNHMKSILSRLHFQDRRQAAAYGITRGCRAPGGVASARSGRVFGVTDHPVGCVLTERAP